jgi:hypothetical protein
MSTPPQPPKPIKIDCIGLIPELGPPIAGAASILAVFPLLSVARNAYASSTLLTSILSIFKISANVRFTCLYFAFETGNHQMK